MFAWKPSTEIAIRAGLIAVIIFNALIPTMAAAMPLSNEEEIVSVPIPPDSAFGTKGSQADILAYMQSRTLFQESTPLPETPTETVVETPTPEASNTPTATPEEAATTPPVVENTATPTPTLEVTAIPSLAPTETSAVQVGSPTLSLEFSASPSQIKTADQVTFTLRIVNQGQSPAAGLQFSNVLPEEFNFLAGKNKGFAFDKQTRELTWLADPETILPPGESLTLEYTVLVVASKDEDVQVIDTAHLRADGLTEPMAVENTLILARPDSSFATVDAQGGEATGLDGRLKLKFPTQSLDISSLVSVRAIAS